MTFGEYPSRPRLLPATRPVALVAALGLVCAVALGASAALDTRIAFALGVALLLAIAAAIRASAILPLLVLSVFIEVVTLGGVTISRLIAPVALVIVVVDLIRGGSQLRRSAPLGWAAAYAIWALASGLWTVSASGTSFRLQSLAIALIFMLAFAALLNTEGELRVVLGVLALAALALGVSSIAAYVGHPLGFGGELQAGRSEGGIGDPNYFANVQVVALPLVLVLAADARRRWFRYGLYGTLLVIVGSILTSLSRGGFVALVLVAALLALLPARALFRSPRHKAAVMLIIAAGTVFFLSRPTLRAQVSKRALSIFVPTAADPGSTSGSGRTNIWLAARATIDERPLLGLGYGSFPPSSNELMLRTPGVDLERYRLRPTGTEAHNAFLGTAAELGLPGLILFLALLISTGLALRRTAVRARASGAAFVGRIGNALVVSLVALLISSLFLETETSRPLWIIVGLSLALPKLISNQAPNPAPAVAEHPARA